VGRELQREYGQAPQVLITTPVLEGLDGVQKMSKSLDNYVGIREPAESMYGKLMSISDDLMWRYFELLSFRPLDDIAALRERVNAGMNPRDAKFELADELVTRFHDAASARAAHEGFVAQFQRGALPEDIATHTVAVAEEGINIVPLLKAVALVPSTSDALRMIKQRAVRIDGERIEASDIALHAGAEHVLQVGKRRFARVSLEKSV
jgi:tyrosyl-tRNA synthetase (EC 6.1.1.1)